MVVMRLSSSSIVVTFLSFAACLLLGCGGGGSDGASNAGDLATIEGRVTRVVSADSSRPPTSTVIAPATLGDIRVEARSSGRTLASDLTDIAGRFRLEFAGAGDIDLVFLTEEFVLELGVVALPGSVVTIAVELRPVRDEVILVDPDDGFPGPLRCETGPLTILDDGLDLVIDGRGEDCLRIGGNCEVDIVARSITLVNCQTCIRTQGNSQTRILAAFGPLVCEARREGVRSAGTSILEIDTSDDLLISAGEYGIRAQGNSTVDIGARGVCSLGGFEPLRIDGNAALETARCGILDQNGR